jgi:AraC-like DNA-binding protein
MITQGRKNRLHPVSFPARRADPALRPRIPFTRACSLFPFVRLLDDVGAPTERFARQANIQIHLLDNPEALVPLHFAHKFAELAAHNEGIENLGMLAGQRTSAFKLGFLGRQLQRALTVYEYLQTGTRLIGANTSGSRFWITCEDGDQIRFNQFSPGNKSAGRCQGDIFTFIVTISMLQRFTNRQWYPKQVTLLHGNEKYLGDFDALAGSEIVTGQSHTSFTLPVSLLQQPIAMPPPRARNISNEQQALPDGIPVDFISSLESLITTLLGNGNPDIHLAAEAAGMSKRTLQRRLTESGHNYSALVTRTRLRIAAERLAETDMPVSEIAASLGYKDASNFTRAFRSQTGVAPSVYRKRVFP